MKKVKPSNPYKGILNENIMLDDKYHTGIFYGGKKGREKFIHSTEIVPISELQEVEKQRATKYPALFQHYKISQDDPNKWELLAKALANNHIEGFKYRYKTGRPEKLGIARKCEFYRAFKQKKASKRQEWIAKQKSTKLTDKMILKSLIKEPEYKKKFSDFSRVLKSLENMLADIRRHRKERIRFIIHLCEISKSDGSDFLIPTQAPEWFYDEKAPHSHNKKYKPKNFD